jgi:hypothetical protein
VLVETRVQVPVEEALVLYQSVTDGLLKSELSRRGISVVAITTPVGSTIVLLVETTTPTLNVEIPIIIWVAIGSAAAILILVIGCGVCYNTRSSRHIHTHHFHAHHQVPAESALKVDNFYNMSKRKLPEYWL